MKAWGSRRTEQAPRIVDQLFSHLQTNAPYSITTQSYNLRLEAWAASKDSKAFERCADVLTILKEHSELKPNVHSYNAYIKAWIRSATQEGVDKAESILQEMHDWYNRTEDIMMAPNRRSFNLLLYGLAHSHDAPKAASRALEIFDYMNRTAEPFCQPNANTFHQLILCLARDDKTEHFEKRLDETFQDSLKIAKGREIEIYADTFNVYMSGWLKSTRPTGLKRILAALDAMEKMYQDGNTITAPNCVTMNTVLAAHIKFSGSDAVDEILITRKRLQSTYYIKPDTTTFNTLIDAHAKSYRATADISALTLLQIMERHLVNGKNRGKPDCYSYCAVIDCLAKCNASGAGDQSRQILRRMIELHQTHGGVQPSLSIYNAVFNAIAASSPVNLTSMETLLAQMEQSADDQVPKPNIITYNSAFKACLRSGTVHGAEWADGVLQSLETQSTPDSALRPDSFSYTTVIAAYGRSLFRNKASKAAELVERALRHYHEGCLDGPPHVSIFNAACNACCFVDGDDHEKAHAFTTMVAISTLLTNYTQPDETTYGTLLRACCQLLHRGEKQQAVVRQVFRKACNDGLCGNFVLKQIRFAADAETYRELTGFSIGESIVREDIPYRWRCKSKYTDNWQNSQHVRGR